MHVLPRVREIEARFEDSLTGIGVHSGKFVTERKTERIVEACDRLNVAHAVVNDRQFRIWRDYAVTAWPTVVVVDPEGSVALVAPGEFDVETMIAQLQRIERRAESRGTLVRGPDPVAASPQRHDAPLRFPTRAILAGGRLWISDTGHGRVLECAWDSRGKHATLVAEHTGFVEPRGLAELHGRIYAADRAGHAIWRLARDDGAPERVAGTGRLGARAIQAGPALHADLRSPWGLSARGGRLAVTMAGSHQLWELDPASGMLALLAGTGGEEIFDAEPRRAALAQPTGAGRMGDGVLVFADCESSAVRVLGTEAVGTLVGTGLFEFGDRPGAGDAALLQHCEDVAFHQGMLAVVDTYNDRLKRLEPTTRECVPWPGEAGEPGALREPGGVWSNGATMLVADTGHHRVVFVEPDGSLIDVELDVTAAG